MCHRVWRPFYRISLVCRNVGMLLPTYHTGSLRHAPSTRLSPLWSLVQQTLVHILHRSTLGLCLWAARSKSYTTWCCLHRLSKTPRWHVFNSNLASSSVLTNILLRTLLLFVTLLRWLCLITPLLLGRCTRLLWALPPSRCSRTSSMEPLRSRTHLLSSLRPR